MDRLIEQSFLEALDVEGKEWDAVLVRSGASKNGNYYPDAVLREAAPLFDGARVYAVSDVKHLGDPSLKRDVNALVGWISSPHFVEGKRVDTGELRGRLNIAAGQAQLRETLVDAWKRGKRDLVGLSIDVDGTAKRSSANGVKRIAQSITKVNSVDLIVEPSAGGALVRLIEAVIGGATMSDKNTYSCRAEELLDEFFSARTTRLSFRECYREITGDTKCTGKIEDCDPVRLREAIGSNTWPAILGAAVNRQMVREYNKGDQYSVWRRLVRIDRNVQDFRAQVRTRIGGYGDLPIVAEGNPYAALVSPADEAATYAVAKRGGTEQLTLEAVRNDDIQAIRLIPRRLAETAQRTLAKFVLDFLRSGPVIYDGVSLFHVSHGNLGAAPLSAAALYAGRVAMRRQTEPGSGEQLRTEPAYLWVPFELEETAVNLFSRGDNNDKTFVQNMKVEVIPVWYWTDVDDWCLSAAIEDLPCIELAFLGGEEDPEVFVQDVPNAGSLFSNDATTLKIRHVYGGTAVDFRGLYKSVV